MGEVLPTKASLQPLSDRIHDYLRETIIKLEKFCTIDTLEKYLKINADIHIYVWGFLKNEFLYTTIRQVFDKFLHNHRHILYTQWTRNDSSLKKSLRLHKKITEALIERDSSHIRSILKKHWDL